MLSHALHGDLSVERVAGRWVFRRDEVEALANKLKAKRQRLGGSSRVAAR